MRHYLAHNNIANGTPIDGRHAGIVAVGERVQQAQALQQQHPQPVRVAFIEVQLCCALLLVHVLQFFGGVRESVNLVVGVEVLEEFYVRVLGFQVAPKCLQLALGGNHKGLRIDLVVDAKFPKHGVSLTADLDNMPNFRINEHQVLQSPPGEVVIEVKIIVLPI